MHLTHRLLGEVEVADSEAARSNLQGLIQHMTAEEVGDLETTMATMARQPFWVNHGTQVYLYSYEAVKTRYANRFRDEPGMRVEIERTVVLDAAAVMRGFSKPGRDRGRVPLVIWLDFQDGHVVGETSYSNPAEASLPRPPLLQD